MQYKDRNGRISHLAFVGNIDRNDGVGGFSLEIIKALVHQGREVSITGVPGINHQGLPDEVRSQLYNPFVAKLGLFNTVPWERGKLTTPLSVGFCGWHTSQLPTAQTYRCDYKAMLETLTEIIVPSLHSKELFEEQGVTRPVHIIPYGLPVDQWPYIERKRTSPFRVVQLGTLTCTKAPMKSVEAFQRAFQDDQDVELVLVTRGGVFDGMGPAFIAPQIDDPRIKVLNAPVGFTQDQLLNLLGQCHCGINLSRGETFAKCPLEMALTGLPVVTTFHTGMRDWFRPEYFYGVDVEGLSDSPYGGQWFEPNIDEAATQLRNIYYGYDFALTIGRYASKYVRENYNTEVLNRNLDRYLTGFGERYD